ncbi:hypothetical protein MVEN_00393300 [Mycena venus]|uniref:Uncharacterized protein n=1 Tax=Mycena venus TaxID=2733690 RepID=A0A8H7DA48_9AGAR|nr:hypothetical protein MVEN_00393300 [Mycena venus]
MSLVLLPDEVLSFIFFSLDDPTSLSSTNRRFLLLSQSPYLRAQYFLARHGPIQALYFAFSRGKLITPRVIDILLASGAHLSRYLVQVAFHHFFHCQSHFLKPSIPWVRNLAWDTWNHFMQVAAGKFNQQIPRGKNEDDGAVFATFIKEAKFPAESQSVSWERIRDIFQKYQFIPFCHRDPLMAQFPLALAIEPRLLPYAVANGFEMDSKYRDFVFRKMFEKTSAAAAAHAEEIVANVRELCRLDSDMFVTRTVAAEACLEAKSNEAAYRALKQLDRAGDLPFSLAVLVQDVIKLFVKARAITSSATVTQILQLYTDFLAPPVPRVYVSGSTLHLSALRAPPPPPRPDRSPGDVPYRLRCGPAYPYAADVLLSAFVEKHTPMFEYLRREGVASEGGTATRKVTHTDLRGLAEDVAVRCLTKDNKGKTLKRLCEAYPTVRSKIVQAVLGEHEIKPEDLALLGKALENGERVQARLARHMGGIVVDEEEGSDNEREARGDEQEDEDEDGDEDVDMESISGEESEDGEAMAGKYQDPQSVAKWIKTEFGPSSSITATFLTHAVINGNNSVLTVYLNSVPPVPITLKHFQALAQLESCSSDYLLYDRIKAGAPFYKTEDDYLAGADAARFLLKKLVGKTKASEGKERKEVPQTPASPHVKTEPVEAAPGSASPHKRKRPRRSAAAAVNSYAVPDSDDEAIAAEEDKNDEFAEFRLGSLGGGKKKLKVEGKEGKPKVQTDLEAWIQALGELYKEEQRKYREKKKRMEKEKAAAAGNGGRIRVSKVWCLCVLAEEDGLAHCAQSDFFRSLTTNLRILRELNAEKRMHRVAAGEEFVESDAEDDEYVVQTKAPKAKRLKTTA